MMDGDLLMQMELFGSDGYFVPADNNNNGIADHLDNDQSEGDGDGVDDVFDDDNDGIPMTPTRVMIL